MLVVTTNDLPGWEIQRVCGEVFGLTVRSPSEMRAGVFDRDATGVLKNLTDSRTDAVDLLIAEARSRGGNAIIAMRFDTTAPGSTWGEVCAYGTAVQAVPVTEGALYTARQLGYGTDG